MNHREILRNRKYKFKTFNLIKISEKRLKDNLEFFEKTTKMQIIPVLKSNAYGHGIREIVEILEKLKVKMIAVDGYFEARKIYRIFSGKILVLGVINRENVKLLKSKRISYVLQSPTDLRAFAKLKRKINVHLELNTGMNRLGLNSDELSKYLQTLVKFKNLHLEGVMTHLASADNSQDPSTESQIREFDEITEKILAAGFSPKYFHIANTAGANRVNSKFANAARVGIGLYGINPIKDSDERFQRLENLQPILELNSTITKVINLETGDKVGYGGSFIAPNKMKIGVLPLGYYEGIPRILSNCGIVTVDEMELPIVGRICMNHMMIDISKTSLQEGDKVTVISQNPKMQNSIRGMSCKSEILEYEILAKLNENVRREII